MTFDPGYGETLVDIEELDSLTPAARAVLGDEVRKAELFDLEQTLWQAVAARSMADILDGSLALDEILTDHFVRELHTRLYGPIWAWAGRQRTVQTNIGVDPSRISVDLRMSLDNLAWRWQHASDLTPRRLGIALHAAVVHVHPFVDGNGRATRLLADLAYAAAQESEPLYEYDWNVDRGRYIALLQEYDEALDPGPLTDFVPVRQVST